ncbi:zinc-binding dehydrogenase [Aeromicrobium sp. CF4.19]|uniref:zinc-dependent alcohol dehydrogenase n=1 Tax=Aeromicrobium sp. CF4.19 TaxID=3373082 RepID=UPI003EE636D3
MRAAVWTGPGFAECRDVEEPEPGPGEVLVAPAYAGICGTDLHIWAGHHPRARPGLILGHEFVGTLTHPAGELGTGTPVFVNPLRGCGLCRSCTEGADHVCDRVRLTGIDASGGAAESVAVPTASLVPLPRGVDLRPFGLTEPASVAVRAVRRSGQGLGDRVHVVGAGPVGLLVALASRLAGPAEISVSEPSESRAETARSLGFEVREVGAGERFDVVYDCAAHPAVTATVLGRVASGGTLMQVGLHRDPVPVDLPDVMRRELTVRGTHVYRPADVRAAIELIASAVLPADSLVSAVLPLEAVQDAFTRLAAGGEVKVLLNARA